MSYRHHTPLSGKALTELDWLVGRWVGKYGDNDAEENWQAPRGGSMICTFRWINPDETIRFFEFFIVEASGDGILMRIKHFGPDLVGWEEKDNSTELDLVHLDKEEAVFLERGQPNPSWLAYSRTGDALEIFFGREDEAPPLKDVFRMQKAE